ncbi:MAG: hypothetical protein MUE94_00550 [Verrucomicrobia bacterium]|jgi:hypothetical protein|nr:hypothetical protein [Verrucomicrobiota bacterium]
MSCGNETTGRGVRGGLTSLVAVAALLIVAALVWAMKHYTTPPSLTAERAALRAANLAELRAAEQAALGSYGWVDQAKGIVRLPLDRAVELTAAAWQNPAQARAELSNRVEAATFVPPPPPAKPSEFE